MKCHLNKAVILLSVGLCITGVPQLDAQVQPQPLTRGKVWFSGNPNGSFERESSLGGGSWELIYPGYWGADNNRANGGFDRTLVYNHAQIAGNDVGFYYRSGNFDDSYFFPIEQTALVKNYNMLNPNEPEEYIKGVIGSSPVVNNRRSIGYALTGRVMAWSIPKYDDFIIIKCSLRNTDTDTIKNFYYSRFMIMDGPIAPSGVTAGWDVEYLWDTEISPEVGFIFYDNTSIPPVGNRPVYTIPPGDSTGNAGDPGNIANVNSKDYRLYSPYLYAYSFLPSSIPMNKNGQRKVWRNILSNAGTAPPEELWPGTFENMRDYLTAVNLITNHQQPEMSWKDANAIYQPGNKAGSLWERNPNYIYSIGPYDIAPGDSISWIEIFLIGQMDRNITMKGGLNATTQFVQKGLVNLKENWAAAQQLIANNYAVPSGTIPPPTPAEAPRIGNTNELQVTPSSQVINGEFVNGVTIEWKDVHTGYVDPQTLSPDFAGYKVYRSDVSIEGPWVMIDSIPLARAQTLTSNGKVSVFEQAFTGVPYRYGVTSFDNQGNESGMTGYTFFPVSAEFQPSNDLSTVRVVPNPFRQSSGFPDPGETKRMAFINIPSKCTIRIYTVALDLVKTIVHDNPNSGLETWGSAKNNDYMLTDFALNVAPGLYIYHVESQVPGQEGRSTVGKFAILK